MIASRINTVQQVTPPPNASSPLPPSLPSEQKLRRSTPLSLWQVSLTRARALSLSLPLKLYGNWERRGERNVKGMLERTPSTTRGGSCVSPVALATRSALVLLLPFSSLYLLSSRSFFSTVWRNNHHTMEQLFSASIFGSNILPQHEIW